MQRLGHRIQAAPSGKNAEMSQMPCPAGMPRHATQEGKPGGAARWQEYRRSNRFCPLVNARDFLQRLEFGRERKVVGQRNCSTRSPAGCISHSTWARLSESGSVRDDTFGRRGAAGAAGDADRFEFGGSALYSRRAQHRAAPERQCGTAWLLKQLRDAGNSVIVVEHDPETIGAADHVIDMGPGAGVNGGEMVAQGRRQNS